MQPNFEVRPPFLCRMLFSPSVSRCRCRDGWLILDTAQGERAVRMEAVLNTRWKDFWLVGTLSLETAQGERTELDWIWKRDAVRITSACRETHSTAEASRRTEVERRKGAARDTEL